ncbi:MAG TPA: PQQ-dependent sugar dehydrogenase, partial [Gemmatimonadaceae bacterium]|nr:PQQ-dependent sugar dehydrogenase [Gemmatimonadaceae bacterium]
MTGRFFLALAVISACSDSQARPAAGKSGDHKVKPAEAASAARARSIKLEQVGGRFTSPVYLTSPPGDSRLFVVEQAGRIIVVKDGRALAEPFLDISARVRSGGEQGLLSMAFHPDYRRTGEFFVNFTDRDGDTRIERFSVSSNADVADRSSTKLVLTVDQPYSNHNGGHILFGLDGMLYIGMGDGGSGGDPHNNGQNPRALLGKLLRINVGRAEPYSIPVGNPYADGSLGRREVWAIGLRNPWRFAFDRPTGLLYIADVGQNQLEEVHVEPSSKPGLNYGWKRMEGDHCYGSGECSREGLQMPAVVYNHEGGACSITGGFVYRGRRVPSLN